MIVGDRFPRAEAGAATREAAAAAGGFHRIITDN
jgi:hypothetical protein